MAEPRFGRQTPTSSVVIPYMLNDGQKMPYCITEPNYDMAVAWKRLEDGNYLPRDITLLQHELLESNLERKYNLTAAEAHSRATAQYNWYGQLMAETKGGGEKDGLL